ncbi:PilW family protein [Parendozoicomonas haliclonae]|uniref:Uncharacterized protein n=1 Tax=Parendozoicomonas haliclonae TaxID=1960125 RepID=A0A1X7AGR7_9GAMM|nr:prepilin-type N-terminal cleavage/methylation domain-containing protein [Parendozoicomonas haliclonae]SMA40320.1 hypothetical protein EHSB41UT_01175 [Parendozoicomonas haliclonae]
MSLRHIHSHQSGISLIELMITLAISSILVLGITRYSIDALASQRTVTSQVNIQDSARIAMERLRRDIQRAGYRGCSDTVRVIDEKSDEAELLLAGVTITGSTTNPVITTAYLAPLLEQTVSLSASTDRKKILLNTPADVSFEEREAAPLFIGNCLSIQQISPANITDGDRAITLVSGNNIPDSQETINELLIDLQNDTLSDNVVLYEYHESTYAYSIHSRCDDPDTSLEDCQDASKGDEKPSLRLNDVAFTSGLERDGLSVKDMGNQVYQIRLNFNDELRNETNKLGLFTMTVKARNLGEEP